MATQSPLYEEPASHEIAAYAHSIWESEGRPEGREISHWFQAKSHLVVARKLDAGMIKTRSKKAPAGRAGQDGAGNEGHNKPVRSTSGKKQGQTLAQSPG